MYIDEVLASYKHVRARARRIPTFCLRRQERKARSVAQDGGIDQLALARLAAIRDELADRGVVPPPVQRGLP